MPEEQALHDLLRRGLNGDDQALAELVRQMEPVVRRAARIHLPNHNPLRRLLDSQDISQSVLRDFFVRAGEGAFPLLDLKDLPRLLRVMARQKFIDRKRQHEAPIRDHRRNRGGDAVRGLTGADDVSETVAERDLYAEVRRRLSRRERAIADLWAAAYTYEEIAVLLKDDADGPLKPNAARMILERAFLRVAAALPQGHGPKADAQLLKAVYRKAAGQLPFDEGIDHDASGG